MSLTILSCCSGRTAKIGLAEFFEIWGGSPSLKLPGVWFHWVNRAMMLAAWREVGFAGGRIDSSQIDRTHFIDRVALGSPSSSTRAMSTHRVDEVVKTPPGVRGKSLAGMMAKFDAVKTHAKSLEARVEELESAEFDPEQVPFLTKPKEIEQNEKRDRSQVDMSLYEGGSASLRNVRKTVGTKRKVVADKAAAVEGRKDERAAKRTEETDAAAKLLTDFDRCFQVCACDLHPCPMQGMKCCATCREAGRPSIKPRLCVVRECVAARKGSEPLALTFVPPVLALTGVEPLLTATEGAAEDAAEDATAEAVGGAEEVMPVPRVWVSTEVRCDWACADAVLTAEEIEVGYCSGRRCKAKMHPECFLHHAGEAGAALGDLVCFCRACWATQ